MVLNSTPILANTVVISFKSEDGEEESISMSLGPKGFRDIDHEKTLEIANYLKDLFPAGFKTPLRSNDFGYMYVAIHLQRRSWEYCSEKFPELKKHPDKISKIIFIETCSK